MREQLNEIESVIHFSEFKSSISFREPLGVERAIIFTAGKGSSWGKEEIK